MLFVVVRAKVPSVKAKEKRGKKYKNSNRESRDERGTNKKEVISEMQPTRPRRDRRKSPQKSPKEHDAFLFFISLSLCLVFRGLSSHRERVEKERRRLPLLRLKIFKRHFGSALRRFAREEGRREVLRGKKTP